MHLIGARQYALITFVVIQQLQKHGWSISDEHLLGVQGCAGSGNVEGCVKLHSAIAYICYPEELFMCLCQETLAFSFFKNFQVIYVEIM